jgi:hypothetical protein
VSRRRSRAAPAEETDASLLDLVDNVLNKGVVVSGDVVLGIAGVDLVYLRLSALLCAVEGLLGRGSGAPPASRGPGD